MDRAHRVRRNHRREDPTSPETWTEENLRQRTVAVLRLLCDQHRLSMVGTKTVLINRLLSLGAGQSSTDAPPSSSAPPPVAPHGVGFSSIVEQLSALQAQVAAIQTNVALPIPSDNFRNLGCRPAERNNTRNLLCHYCWAPTSTSPREQGLLHQVRPHEFTHTSLPLFCKKFIGGHS